MVQSVESTNVLSLYSSQGVLGTTSSTQSTSQKEEQTTKTQQYDTVELSAEAQAYAQQQSTAAVSETQAASDALKNASKQVASAAESKTTDTSEVVSSETATTETSSSQTPVLSGLSEQELNDLVSEGTISKAELQAELSRRESAKNAQSTEDTSSAANGSYAAGIAAYQQESTSVQSLLDYTA